MNLPTAVHLARMPGVVESEPVAAARRTVEAWNRGDDDSIRAAFSEDVHYVPSGEIPGYTNPIDGIEEYLGFFHDWMGSFADYRLTPMRIADIGGGAVLVDTEQQGTSTSGAEVSRRVFMYAEMRGGRCASYAAFGDEAGVLARAGLDSWPEQGE
jgi:ketosteroid isomerase-like protein